MDLVKVGLALSATLATPVNLHFAATITVFDCVLGGALTNLQTAVGSAFESRGTPLGATAAVSELSI
jgi:hypothetical protein